MPAKLFAQDHSYHLWPSRDYGGAVPTRPEPTAWVRDGVVWLALVTAGGALTAAASAGDVRLGTGAAPFTGRYSLHVDAGSVIAPVVAAAVLLAARARLHERVPWRWLLLSSYGAAAAWAFALALVEGGAGLARPIDRPDGYLPELTKVGDDPLHYLREFTASAAHTPSARVHPPAPVLLLWALDRIGVHAPLAMGVVVTLVGALSVPLVVVAVRSLCHEPAARRLLPAVVLAPYVVWLAVSLDAVALTLVAAAFACTAVGTEPGRAPWWAFAAGVLLGVAALFAYSAPWIALSLLLICFVRRRALLILLIGAGLLMPLLLAWPAGFAWQDGLSTAQAYTSETIGPHRSWPAWVPLDVLVVVIACGPLLVTAARKVRRTPGWPFVVGAALGVGFAIASGLTRGEAERAFLAFFPWLLVPASAPDVRPVERGESASAPVSLTLVGLAAVAAIVVEAVLRSPW